MRAVVNWILCALIVISVGVNTYRECGTPALIAYVLYMLLSAAVIIIIALLYIYKNND